MVPGALFKYPLALRRLFYYDKETVFINGFSMINNTIPEVNTTW